MFSCEFYCGDGGLPEVSEDQEDVDRSMVLPFQLYELSRPSFSYPLSRNWEV